MNINEIYLCPVMFTPLTDAVATSCLHKFSEVAAVQLFGPVVNNRCAKEAACPMCRRKVEYWGVDHQYRELVKAHIEMLEKMKEMSKKIEQPKSESQVTEISQPKEALSAQDKVRVIIAIAKVYAQKSSFEEAYRELNKAQELDPHSPKLQLAFNEVNALLLEKATLLRKDNVYAALKLVNILVEEYPASVEGKILRGSILAKLGHYSLALLPLDSALRLKPNDCAALTMRWYVNVNLGRYHEAFDDLEMLIEQQPNNENAIAKRNELNSRLITETDSFTVGKNMYVKINNKFELVD